ncbi:MAG: hypothetical protein AAFV29_13040, partial [Myxococcota bacterium]
MIRQAGGKSAGRLTEQESSNAYTGRVIAALVGRCSPVRMSPKIQPKARHLAKLNTDKAIEPAPKKDEQPSSSKITATDASSTTSPDSRKPSPQVVADSRRIAANDQSTQQLRHIVDGRLQTNADATNALSIDEASSHSTQSSNRRNFFLEINDAAPPPQAANTNATDAADQEEKAQTFTDEAPDLDNPEGSAIADRDLDDPLLEDPQQAAAYVIESGQ